ncbi:WD40/YVTN/BNR-like repeat-containing protein [Aestuariivirga sp. YIM B02566]|uniref:Exo-alpha-sialidase n=1 Tax=Taklimakanibacter albus TaxID=2800327 RepID=A0ACC5R0W0_9HYPH|nr:exo-alpha-sialidase [Aestuariivirga sp. YIM B02566]MBK1866284.1 exo-alpha-sialidase [Aestuariivirga sp. YIM B02566]
MRIPLWATLFATLFVIPASAETLAELGRKTHYHGIAFARSGTAALMIATHHGLYAVDKDGSVTRVSPVQDFMGFSPDPANELGYFASGHPATGGNSGFLRSVDGGANWTQLSPGVDGPVDFHQMDVSGADPKVVYGGFGQIQVSRDGGATWEIAGDAPERLIALAASSLKAERLYAATENGVLVSEDGARSWAPLAFAGEVASTIQTGPDKALYAFVVGRGLMKASEDKPDSWSVLTNDFGEAIPLHLATNTKDGQQLALTMQNNEVRESRDGGKSWRLFGQTSP